MLKHCSQQTSTSLGTKVQLEDFQAPGLALVIHRDVREAPGHSGFAEPAKATENFDKEWVRHCGGGDAGCCNTTSAGGVSAPTGGGHGSLSLATLGMLAAEGGSTGRSRLLSPSQALPASLGQSAAP